MDTRIADRIREALAARPGVIEKKMFGGIGWMLQGNMAVGTMDASGLLVRVEPDDVDALLREPGVTTFGREGAKPMQGFVVVTDAEALSDEEFAVWVDRGADRALSLPPK